MQNSKQVWRLLQMYVILLLYIYVFACIPCMWSSHGSVAVHQHGRGRPSKESSYWKTFTVFQTLFVGSLSAHFAPLHSKMSQSCPILQWKDVYYTHLTMHLSWAGAWAIVSFVWSLSFSPEDPTNLSEMLITKSHISLLLQSNHSGIQLDENPNCVSPIPSQT